MQQDVLLDGVTAARLEATERALTHAAQWVGARDLHRSTVDQRLFEICACASTNITSKPPHIHVNTWALHNASQLKVFEYAQTVRRCTMYNVENVLEAEALTFLLAVLHDFWF